MNPSPTPEERIWSVLSHLSVLAFGMGILLPIVGWSEQREKSKYASFQCLQALGYQTLGYTIWLLTYLLVLVLFLPVLVFASLSAEGNEASNAVWPILIMVFMFGMLAVYLLFPCIAVIACALGRDFHYPLMGTRLARYIGYQPINSGEERTSLIAEHEERWVASMGHFSIIVALWGIIAPTTTWILQGKHSAFLKFQSIQTTVYQVIVNLLYLGAIVVDILGIIVFVTVLGITGNSSTNTPGGMVALILFFLALIIAALIVLVIPLFHILGQWAGYRVLKGDNYRYPILGKLVEKRLANQSYGDEQLAVRVQE